MTADCLYIYGTYVNNRLWCTVPTHKRLCLGSFKYKQGEGNSLGGIQTSLKKYKMGDISKVANKLEPATGIKKYM
jgi:hypothetical protein